MPLPSLVLERLGRFSITSCVFVRKSIVQAIIMSRLDYCNGLLYSTPAGHLGKLQRLQNAGARLVCTISRYDPITPSLINLHWLSVTHRIEFKIAMGSVSSIHP